MKMVSLEIVVKTRVFVNIRMAAPNGSNSL